MLMTHTLLFPLFQVLLTETSAEIISLICCPMQPEETFAQVEATTREKII